MSRQHRSLNKPNHSAILRLRGRISIVRLRQIEPGSPLLKAKAVK
jgi:hypothetical protein